MFPRILMCYRLLTFKNITAKYSLNTCIKNNNLKLLIKNIKYHLFYINNDILFWNKSMLKNSKNNLYIEKISTNKRFTKTNILDLFCYIAIIRVTGRFNIHPNTKKTLKLLKIQLPNSVIIVKKSKAIMHLIRKINNHVLWGEISKSVLLKLIMKKKNVINVKVVKKIEKTFTKNNNQITNDKYINLLNYILSDKSRLNFRLNSPSIHFSRKDSGTSTNIHVGYVGKLINNFLIKMF